MEMKSNGIVIAHATSKTAHPLVPVLMLPTHPPHFQSFSPPTTRYTYILHLLHTLLLSFHAFLIVPFYATLLSLIVALMPSLQSALKHNSDVTWPMNEAVGMCENCIVPLTLVV